MNRRGTESAKKLISIEKDVLLKDVEANVIDLDLVDAQLEAADIDRYKQSEMSKAKLGLIENAE